MKESAVPSVWPLCPLGAQTAVAAAAGKPPSSSIRDPSRPAAQPRQERPVPAGPVNSPRAVLAIKLWAPPWCVGTTVQIAGHPPHESDRPGSGVLEVPERPGPAPFGNTSSSRFRP